MGTNHNITKNIDPSSSIKDVIAEDHNDELSIITALDQQGLVWTLIATPTNERLVHPDGRITNVDTCDDDDLMGFVLDIAHLFG